MGIFTATISIKEHSIDCLLKLIRYYKFILCLENTGALKHEI